MAAPTRFTSGITQDNKWQPLGEIGIPDPFFYACYEDDFLPYNAANYTVTAAGGSAASSNASGPGGRVLLTTGATAGNFAELQLPTASFKYTAGKKLVYLARVNVAQLTDAVIFGLINTTATPFTGGSITDGIYFSSPAGSTSITLSAVTGGAVIGSTVLTTTGAVNTDLDFGFIVDARGNIRAYSGANLLGSKRPNTALLGPNNGIASTSLTGSLTTVLLNPTVAVSNGSTAAAGTMAVDLQLAAQER